MSYVPMNTETTSRPASASPGRGAYAVTAFPQHIQLECREWLATTPPIIIEPILGERREVSLVDSLSFILLSRIGEDMTDIIASFLHESRPEPDDFMGQVILLDETTRVIEELARPYIQLLPEVKWAPVRILPNSLIVVRC